MTTNRREYNNKVVRIGPYFLAKTLAELPFYLVYPTIYIVIAYFLVGYTVSAVSTYYIYIVIAYFLVGYSVSAVNPMTM